MRGSLKPLVIAAVMLALALAAWAGAHAADGTTARNVVSLAAIARQHPTELPHVQPTESPEVQPTESPEVQPTERPEDDRDEQVVTPVATPSAGTAGPASTATFDLVGGSVTLSCSFGSSIMVDLVAPNPAFSVRVEHEDGEQAVEVRFEGPSHESRLQARCAGGQVQLLELREESS